MNAAVPGRSGWLLTDDELRGLLARAHAGEAPDTMMLEAYANSSALPVEGEDGT